MSEKEIGLREGRAKFGDLVNRAEYARQSTIITRHGRPAAMITPVPQHIALRDITTAATDQGDWRDQAIDDWLEAAAAEGYGFTVLASYDEGDVLAVVARDEWKNEEVVPGERMTLRIARSGLVAEGDGEEVGIEPGPYDCAQHPVTASSSNLQKQTVTVADIAREFNVTEADVLALADQLTTLDGSENVVASEENSVVTLTANAAAVIRDQLSG